MPIHLGPISISTPPVTTSGVPLVFDFDAVGFVHPLGFTIFPKAPFAQHNANAFYISTRQQKSVAFILHLFARVRTHSVCKQNNPFLHRLRSPATQQPERCDFWRSSRHRQPVGRSVIVELISIPFAVPTLLCERCKQCVAEMNQSAFATKSKEWRNLLFIGSFAVVSALGCVPSYVGVSFASEGVIKEFFLLKFQNRQQPGKRKVCVYLHQYCLAPFLFFFSYGTSNKCWLNKCFWNKTRPYLWLSREAGSHYIQAKRFTMNSICVRVITDGNHPQPNR